METPSQASSSSIVTATAGEITTNITSAARNTNDDNNTTTRNPQIQNSLRSLNKSSYKISKPPSRNPNPAHPNPNPNPTPQSQPPVYNIDKSNFREVVQKLTGSPSHVHSHQPPPPPSASVSRLHRIRPPPLSNLSMVSAAGPTPSLSPLPPLPSVSAVAESPITAYMRRLRGGPSPTVAITAPPLSPLGFGCSGSVAMVPTSPRLPLPSPSTFQLKVLFWSFTQSWT